MPCPACGPATHRHRTLDHDEAHTHRPRAGPDPVHVSTGEETEAAWIALIPGDYPANVFAHPEVYHLSGQIAWPGPHPRDYGTARIAHDACCPGLHASQPVTSRGAGELWRAMRLRLARHSRTRP
ncbi:hypothetical protein DKG34_38620 [Streptomyces sp. NWU49]|nr:hypothetical protein DKG34_38620 [Streptomyces sp. NWU49]